MWLLYQCLMVSIATETNIGQVYSYRLNIGNEKYEI